VQINYKAGATKRIALSLVTVFALGALVAGVAYAVFSDTEKIEGNTIATGEVKMNLTWHNKPYAVENAYPGWWSDWGWVNIQSQPGSVPMEAFLSFEKTSGSTDLYNKLRLLLVADYNSSCDGAHEVVVYDGLLKNFPHWKAVSGPEFWTHGTEQDGSGPGDNIPENWSVRLCQKVGVDISAGDDLENTSVTFDEIATGQSDND
jgi:predicted ribosomally synthesized peptide with SipW-like signal peptide